MQWKCCPSYIIILNFNYAICLSLLLYCDDIYNIYLIIVSPGIEDTNE